MASLSVGGHPMPTLRLQEVRAGSGSDENQDPEDDPATREAIARAEPDLLRTALSNLNQGEFPDIFF